MHASLRPLIVGKNSFPYMGGILGRLMPKARTTPGGKLLSRGKAYAEIHTGPERKPFATAGNPLPTVVHEQIESKVDKGRVIIVGDIHGCLTEFQELLTSCHFKQDEDLLILVRLRTDHVGCHPAFNKNRLCLICPVLFHRSGIW
jgi:hypothetical protein